MFVAKFTDIIILSCMSHQPQTPAAIADDVGCSTMTIIRALPCLEEEGLVERVTIASTNGRSITGWFSSYNYHKIGRCGHG
jgi:predicted ArsR family transcriptional regulator